MNEKNTSMGCLNQGEIKHRSLTWYTASSLCSPFVKAVFQFDFPVWFCKVLQFYWQKLGSNTCGDTLNSKSLQNSLSWAHVFLRQAAQSVCAPTASAITTKMPVDMTEMLRLEFSLKILDSICQNQTKWNASPVLSWQIFSLFVFTQRKLASPKTFWLPFTSEPWVFLVYTVLEPHLPICQPKICFHMKQKWNYVGQSSFEVLWLNEQNFKQRNLAKSCEIS